MNFSSQLNKAITNVLHSYIEEISNKYNIDKTELFNLWDGQSESKNKEIKTSSKNSDRKVNSLQEGSLRDMPKVNKDNQNDLLNKESLNKLTVPDLKVMLSNKGLKVSGTKVELIDRLLASSTSGAKGENEGVSKNTSKPTRSEVKTPISQPIFQLRRNNFGNYEHEETHLVFNSDKKVIGMQKQDGKIEPLCKLHVDLCNKYKFEYIIPENLDSNKNLNNVKVSEIDDDDFDEEDDIDIEDIVEEDVEDLLEEDEEILEEDEEIVYDDE